MQQILYLLKAGTSQNTPKPAETTQKLLKRPKKLRNNAQFQNWGNPEFSSSFRCSKFEPK